MRKIIHLKPRLQCIADCLPSKCRIADIGTDHARLIVSLMQQDPTRMGIATDISKGPLDMASRMIQKCHLSHRIQLRQGDGCTCILPEEVDWIIISGMGGDTIASILKSSIWLREKPLVLQAQSHGEKVIEVLDAWERSFFKRDAYESQRQYTILVCPTEEGGTYDTQ